MAAFVTMTGRSGFQYHYEICTFLGNWIELPGNYAFACQTGLLGGLWEIFYIGQSENLRNRMDGHTDWPPAVKLGATHVLAHVNQDGDSARFAEEADLIAAYNPPLNVQQRTPAAVPGFGPGLLGRRASLLGGE